VYACVYHSSVEIIDDDAMETTLEESMASYPSVDHLVTEVHPSNMEVSPLKPSILLLHQFTV